MCETISFAAEDLAEEQWAGDYDPDEERDVLMEVMDRDMRDKYGTCSFCDGTLRPTGSCFTCESCGETTGCS